MFSRLLLLVSLVIGACASLPAQTNKPLDPSRKTLQAVRVAQAPSLDGLLDESFWQEAPIATDFVVNQPNPGSRPSQPSEVRVVYTDYGLYVGARLFDSSPDSILQEITQRDNIGNSEWFGIFIDSYRDGINGFGFIVTPADVQFDAKYSTFGEDPGWDAVWRNKAARTSDGWSVEMEIPYSAIRFPDIAEQTWHLNFGRLIARNQQKAFWSELDPKISGFLNQAGYLTNISNIKAPLRIQATPFLAVYGLHHHDAAQSPAANYGTSINGGMDVKVGLSDAFTLDMTLIPDFGEAQSDNQVLNLSPFEVQFDENRAFFTEGTELFNKGGLFYSRRIGGTPLRYYEVNGQLRAGEEIIENPVKPQLYNATKISGRTAKGTGIGFFNATSGRTVARIRNAEGEVREFETDPLTNYNVLVIDQNLPHNSFLTLINTTALRSGDAYDANVTGTEFLLRNKKNTHSLGGGGALSQQYFSEETVLGHQFNLSLRKTAGKLLYGMGYSEESDKYDPNDLGLLFNNNSRRLEGYVEYNQFEPFGNFNRGVVGLSLNYGRLYEPGVYTDWGVNLFAYAQAKNFWQYEVWTYIEPSDTYDYFEPRVPGRFLRNPTAGNAGFWVGTDQRKKLRLTLNANHWRSAREGQHNLSLNTSARYRISDRFNFGGSLGRYTNQRDLGYVNVVESAVADPVSGELNTVRDVILGQRDRHTLELGLNANYTFNANMALTFRLRHYWSTARYDRYFLLEQDGDLGDTGYSNLHDIDYDVFNIDLIYRWRFAPGSDLIVVYKNNISSATEQPLRNYWKNLDGLLDSPQDNQLSVKLVYFLDYASLFK